MDTITGVLLAGGKSRRMGRDKRFLELGGDTLLRRALSVYERLFDEIVIVVAEPLPHLPDIAQYVVTDLIPNRAALGGLYTGLSTARNQRIFAAACDMPFLNPDVITYLVRLGDEDVVMPKLAPGVQPMHAVYSKACLPTLRQMIDAGHLAIQDILANPQLRIRLVPEEELRRLEPDLLSFLNVNTPEDVAYAQTLVQREKAFKEGP